MHTEMVSMRDGVKLATDVYIPAGGGRFPVLASRTPYGKSGVRGDAEYLVKRGYVVLTQDCRGRFDSQGDFYGFVNEGPDGYDTIEWAAAQRWSDGQVGTFGASYLAWDQYFAAMYRPPHLIAMFALVGGAKFYDEYAYPGGIPNLGWPIWMLKSAQTSSQAAKHSEEAAKMAGLLQKTPVPWLKLSPEQRGEIFRDFPDQQRMYSDFLAHPKFDSYWKQKGFYTAGYYDEMKDVPTLFLTGWYDYFSQGVLENFTRLSRMQHSMKRLVIGPWPHATGAADCGDAWFGDSAAVNQRALMADWFDHWTKHKAFKLVSDMPVQYFRMGGGSGARTAKGKLDDGGIWLTGLSWPPVSAKAITYYLHGSDVMNELKPGHEKGSLLAYDPRNPVPTLGGRYGVGGWSKSCAQDGRMNRSDLLSFSTDELNARADITGDVKVTIWAKSDAASVDFDVKLLDVYPDGYALTLIDGGTRATFSNTSTPKKMTVDLGSVSNLFAKHHRIRIDIAGSNFPKLDLNPSPSHSTILHDEAYPTSVALPMMKANADEFADVVRSTVMVPMRDGVKLSADIYLPSQGQEAVVGKFPVLVTRSPYDKNGERRRGEFFAHHGYVFVAQDVRGKYASEGEPYPLIHDGKDGYDTIEWAAGQQWSNGKVGTTGASYLAMDQYAAAIERPPHLVAMYTAVGGANYYYDSAYRGGMPGLGWPVWLLLSAATDPRSNAGTRKRLTEIVNHPDQWLAELREQRGKIFAGYPAQQRAYEDFVDNPDFDAYWRQVGFDTSDYYRTMKDVPILFVSGWYDSFADATLENFIALRRIQKTPKRLIMGAWPHGYGKCQCGQADFGPQDELDENPIQLDWFNHWMKDRPFEVIQGDAVQYFRMGGSKTERNGSGEITPGGEWKSAPAWPPALITTQEWFLGEKHLTRKMPEATSPDVYSYDPANPVHTLGARNGPQCIQDQTQRREDIVSFSSDPLAEGKDVTGKVRVMLWVSSDAPSADFTAKLIDVYPDGYAAPLLDGGKRVALTKNVPQKVIIDLGTTSNLFAKGHRIRLDVSSSSFPKWEPNPNAARNSIYHDPKHASYVELPVTPQ